MTAFAAAASASALTRMSASRARSRGERFFVFIIPADKTLAEKSQFRHPFYQKICMALAVSRHKVERELSPVLWAQRSSHPQTLRLDDLPETCSASIPEPTAPQTCSVCWVPSLFPPLPLLFTSSSHEEPQPPSTPLSASPSSALLNLLSTFSSSSTSAAPQQATTTLPGSAAAP